MDEAEWAVVPAQVKGGHVVEMAIDLTDIVAVWPTPDGVQMRHTNGGTTLVLMRPAEVAALVGLDEMNIPGGWYAGVGE